MREAWLSAEFLKPAHTCLAKGLPIGRSEVDSLVEVEAVIETRVVRLGKGDDKLTGALIKRIDLNARLPQLIGRKNRHQLEEEIRLGLKQLRHRFLHGFFKPIGVFARNAIPRLGGAKMLVVR